jgi:hypothetical protein
LFEEYWVEDMHKECSHLTGFVFAEEHADSLEPICREDLRTAHIASRLIIVRGFSKVKVVGKRLEEPFPFIRYRAGTMTARVRRYFEDFPKPNCGAEEDQDLESNFVRSLESSAAHRKKQVRQAKQRLKRREKRAKDARVKVFETTGKEGFVVVN